MPLFLSSRDTESVEKMDDPTCDREELENTYRQFQTINALISQWRKIYRKRLRPYLRANAHCRLLDIGFGGGDIPIKLAQWANNDKLNLSITAIDPDERAYKYVQQLTYPENINFLPYSISELADSERQFDFVISNHLLHHLSPKDLPAILRNTQKLSRHAVIFNDIRRSDIAYAFFNLLAPPIFRSSFITQDGLTSIRRSYTFEELAEVAPRGWQVQKLFPFRLLLCYYDE